MAGMHCRGCHAGGTTDCSEQIKRRDPPFPRAITGPFMISNVNRGGYGGRAHTHFGGLHESTDKLREEGYKCCGGYLDNVGMILWGLGYISVDWFVLIPLLPPNNGKDMDPSWMGEKWDDYQLLFFSGALSPVHIRAHRVGGSKSLILYEG